VAAPAQTIWLDQAALRRLDPRLLEIRPEAEKRVAAIFTRGKDHPAWAAAGIRADNLKDRGTAGVNVRVSQLVQAGLLAASVAIDVERTAGPVTTVEMTFRNTSTGRQVRSFDDARRGTLKCLVHELEHVRQHWILGRTWDGRAVSDERYAEAYRRHGDANVYEFSAYSFAESWISAHEQAIAAGAFDDLLPIAMIEALAPRRPTDRD
jgi:hypothetical protein